MSYASLSTFDKETTSIKKILVIYQTFLVVSLKSCVYVSHNFDLLVKIRREWFVVWKFAYNWNSFIWYFTFRYSVCLSVFIDCGCDFWLWVFPAINFTKAIVYQQFSKTVWNVCKVSGNRYVYLSLSIAHITKYKKNVELLAI